MIENGIINGEIVFYLSLDQIQNIELALGEIEKIKESQEALHLSSRESNLLNDIKKIIEGAKNSFTC